jgi:mannitol/fructose-specific phosphotransferase system IIA component (Ntr-type)
LKEEERLQMTLVEVFPRSMWIPELKSRDKKAVIREMLNHLVAEGRLKEEAARKAEKAIHKRESQGSTAIGKGLAIPHARGCSFLKELLGVFGRSREGVPFDSVDGGLVHVVFLVISSEELASEHLGLMKRIARLHLDEKTLRFLARDEKLTSMEEILEEVDDNFG